MIDANTPLTLNVTAGEMQIVMSALGEMPFRISAGLIGKLEQQVREQAPDAFELPTQALTPPANGALKAEV